MVIKTHPKFDKLYKKRILSNSNLDIKFKERIKLFTENHTHPLLEDHKLKGDKKGYRSFSVTGDIRVIYYPVSDSEVILVEVGSHNQVY